MQALYSLTFYETVPAILIYNQDFKVFSGSAFLKILKSYIDRLIIFNKAASDNSQYGEQK